MFVRHFMSQDVESAGPDDSTRDCLRRMRELQIRRLPIVRADRVVGMVSERHLHSMTHGAAGMARVEQIEAALAAPVRTLMTTEVLCIGPNEHIEAAAHLMLENRIGGLPVVQGQKLVGIITESDIFRGLWEILRGQAERRIYFEETGRGVDSAPPYDELCRRRGARLTSLLRHRASNGETSGVVGIVGGNIDRLVDDLWRSGARVVSVESAPAPGANPSPAAGAKAEGEPAPTPRGD